MSALSASCMALDSDLKNAISFGEIKYLDKYSPEVEKQLYLRLFQSPVYIKNCFEETHGICFYKYYLSVSTYDEYPETNIYELKSQGEIKNIKYTHGKRKTEHIKE